MNRMSLLGQVFSSFPFYSLQATWVQCSFWNMAFVFPVLFYICPMSHVNMSLCLCLPCESCKDGCWSKTTPSRSRHGKSEQSSASGNCQTWNFRKKTRKLDQEKSCLYCIYCILYTRIPIIGINEVIPQTFGLISTSKMNFLKNFPHFFLFQVPNFRIGQKLPRAALAPLASFCMSVSSRLSLRVMWILLIFEQQASYCSVTVSYPQLRILYNAGYRLGPDTTRRASYITAFLFTRFNFPSGEQGLPEEDQTVPSPSRSGLLCCCLWTESRCREWRPYVTTQRLIFPCHTFAFFFTHFLHRKRCLEYSLQARHYANTNQDFNREYLEVGGERENVCNQATPRWPRSVITSPSPCWTSAPPSTRSRPCCRPSPIVATTMPTLT